MSRFREIRRLVESGLFYLSEHADFEADGEGFDIYDVEHALLNGYIRKTWPKEEKYEIVGSALDGRRMGIICRITRGGKLRVITVYEDKPNL